MDPITIAIALGVSAVLLAAIKVYQVIKKKNQEIGSLITTLETYSESYSFDTCDPEIIANVRRYLNLQFHGNYESVFNSLSSMEEKKSFLEKIAHDLASEMGIVLDNIDIIPIDDYTRGCTSADGKKVTIHEALLIADPEQAVRTLCHELRHCMQCQAITDNKWGFSPDRIASWMLSFQQYGKAEGFYSSYIHFIVEVDANKFAEAVV